MRSVTLGSVRFAWPINFADLRRFVWKEPMPALTLTVAVCLAHADTCAQLMSSTGRGLTYATLKAALQQVVPANSPATSPNGGLA